MITIIFILAVIGFCISLYTYLLEKKVKQNPGYKPVCDISDKISCTKPMKSAYANIFYISNALVGMVFYAVMAVGAFLNLHQLLFILACIGCIGSIVLAYFLFFKVKSFCLLCTSLYIINALLLYMTYIHR